MRTTIHDESHVATVDFLATKLWEHKTWTTEKRIVFSVLKKYLIYIGANIVYKNSMNSLNKLGSSVYVSNLKGWFPEALVKSGTAEKRILIGHRDKTRHNKGKEFAVLKLNSYSTQKELEYFEALIAKRDLRIHDLWFKNEMPDELWEALRNEEKKNGPLEFSREDEGIGASWYGTDVTGDDELDQQLYWKLEDSAIELQDLGGMYPELQLNTLTRDIMVITVL